MGSGGIGSITVDADELGLPGGGLAVDLRFAVLDPPSIGRNLLGERFYRVVEERLERDGGSAVYIGGDGDLSFKGAGFARGGIFDRFQFEQDGRIFVFEDVDFINLPKLEAEGAPELQEGGIFFVDAEFDPASPWMFQLTVPFRVEDERTYATFLDEYQLPSRFIESERPFWVERWIALMPGVVFLVLLILGTATAFFFRQRLLPYRKVVHVSVATLAAVGAGLVFKAQPSTTQILTLTGSAVERRFPSAVFLSEPLIFIFWISIVVTLFIWGRGFFCGWLCPYGAMLEVLLHIWVKVVPEKVRHKLESWEPPTYWRYGKYVTFLVILLVSFFSLPLAEALDEIEPFKTFVLRLVRPGAFVAYFLIITAVSVVSHRFFCRFMCPLGGALAIPSRKPMRELVRYDLCQDCKICGQECEPRAISFETGKIDYRECLHCWDCQYTAQNTARCPELIRAAKENRPPRVVAGAVLLVLLLAPAEARAATWEVTPQSGSLQAAVSRASEGDLIVVGAGIYREQVVIDRALTLRGEEGAIVDGGGVGTLITVEAPGVVVEGMTLRNCGLEPEVSHAGIRVEQAAADALLADNRIEGCRFGIWLHGSPDAVARGNRIRGVEELLQEERGDCIHLWNVSGATISGNELTECRDGVYMELSHDCSVTGNEVSHSRYAVHTMWCDRGVYNDNRASDSLVGLALMFSSAVEASGNILHNNATHGILLVQVTRGRAIGNTLIGNTKGLFVYNSLYNEIRSNLVARNNLGLHYWGGSEDNEVEDNAFIENELQVEFVAAKDQTWEGNFWSDYDGWDLDGDGHGEVAYRSNTLVDAVLAIHPLAKLLLTSPSLQLLALAEREFPIIRVPKAVDPRPRSTPAMSDWQRMLHMYPARPADYFGPLDKLPHVPGEHH